MINAAEEPIVPVRGPRLLLAHCERVDRLDPSRPSARDRLEATLGSELTQLLLAALAGENRMRVPRAVA